MCDLGKQGVGGAGSLEMCDLGKQRFHAVIFKNQLKLSVFRIFILRWIYGVFFVVFLHFHVDHRSAYTCGSEGDPCYNSDNDRKFKSTCIHKANTNRTFAITFGSSEYSIVTCWYLSHVHLPLCVYPVYTVL